MVRFTQEEVSAYQAKRAAAAQPQKPVAPRAACESESKLHDEILDYCRQRGWYVVHARMDKPTTTGIGVPDFVIAVDGGRTLWIECKGKSGKVTTDQRAAQAWLKKLGHRAYIVWNFDGIEGFKAALKDAGL